MPKAMRLPDETYRQRSQVRRVSQSAADFFNAVLALAILEPE